MQFLPPKYHNSVAIAKRGMFPDCSRLPEHHSSAVRKSPNKSFIQRKPNFSPAYSGDCPGHQPARHDSKTEEGEDPVTDEIVVKNGQEQRLFQDIPGFSWPQTVTELFSPIGFD